MNADQAKDKVEKKLDDASNSAAADKARGHSDELVGSVKEKVGSVIGDDKLEAEGQVQNAEGKAERMKGEFKEKIDDATDKVKAGVGAVKDKVNELLDK